MITTQQSKKATEQAPSRLQLAVYAAGMFKVTANVSFAWDGFTIAQQR